MNKGSVTVVLGLQRGDEGKGRFVDEIASSHDIVARFNGGPNAGHTVVLPDGTELDLHTVPSGISHSGVVNVIGNGCLIDPVKLVQEFNDLKSKGVKVTPENLKISTSAHLILPSHIVSDKARENSTSAQGSTSSGIAQVSADKYLRAGLTLGQAIANPELLREKTNSNQEYINAIKQLADFSTDTVIYVNQQLSSGKKVLAEGAQAFLLDIDHGMYPFTTSSTTTVGGVCTGLGIPAKYINKVIGVVKATQSHVGGGPFVTEITDETQLNNLRGKQTEVDGEFGTTTGRARRMGHLDLPQIKRAIMVNGITHIAITKLDCVPRFGNKIQVCTSYKGVGDIAPVSADALAHSSPEYENSPSWAEDISLITEFSKLPENAQNYVKFIEQKLATPIFRIGVGPNRTQVIKKD
ncbi:hypothetical protein A3F37_04285 [Candidatus Saccharibacteria bacterium RIFCSPHIGHO2_12_FULL_41_12]|nr:MAG: hypothetical protein A3F37_04285 [Candidatus Saccharibacteria bacterium RIFCSPHIGHO2_12_FULL_41_12]